MIETKFSLVSSKIEVIRTETDFYRHGEYSNVQQINGKTRFQASSLSFSVFLSVFFLKIQKLKYGSQIKYEPFGIVLRFQFFADFLGYANQTYSSFCLIKQFAFSLEAEKSKQLKVIIYPRFIKHPSAIFVLSLSLIPQPLYYFQSSMTASIGRHQDHLCHQEKI